MSEFADRLIRWHVRFGRHDLPWQNTTDAYRVWLSEIMLQQTQVATVMPYYARFLERFPTMAALAQAPVEDVMALWSGLGYYARARNLHACARLLMAQHGGHFPPSPAAIAALPGIGRSTANSIATFCFGARAPILDGNVKRVLCRAFGVEGFPGSSAVEKRLWALAETLMPARESAVYNQAQMDLGALVCTRSKPRCKHCPVAESCIALASGRTGELPQPKPRKPVPERNATLLIVRDGAGRVFLETRPPAGIWGGLQSLPELPEGWDAHLWLQQKFGSAPEAALGRSSALTTPGAGSCSEPPSALHSLGPAQALSSAQRIPCAVIPAPTWRHAFTHFRLLITPLLCTLERTATMTEPGAHWLAPEQLAKAALPAPVRGILIREGLIEGE